MNDDELAERRKAKSFEPIIEGEFQLGQNAVGGYVAPEVPDETVMKRRKAFADYIERRKRGLLAAVPEPDADASVDPKSET